jgi:hypothetical protein
MALYDWETASQATAYTKAADRKRLAADAAALIAGNQTTNRNCPTDVSHRKASESNSNG